MTDGDNDRHEVSGVNRRGFLGRMGTIGGLAVLGTTGEAAAREDPQYGPRTEAAVSEDVTKPTAVREFPVLDADGNETGETRRWRTVKGTGNCCENYLAAAPDGTLYDMGGDLLRVSPDSGETWHEIGPSTPYPATSEGCVSAAPNGDVCAIDWNPYSPDRVIAYKWVAADETWYYTEVPLHTPFYDRPWQVIVPGPFEVGGEEVPYVSIMRGGWPDNSELYVSFDGLNYQYASTRFVDSLIQGDVESYLAEAGGGTLDWTQPHTETYVAPLGDGRAIGDETVVSARASFAEAGCDATVLGVGDAADELLWSCFDTPRGFEFVRTQVDAKGRIHQVEFLAPGEFEYRVSADGGKTWTRHVQELPGEFELADGLALYDFKVLTTGARGSELDEDLAAVAVHATREGDGDDGETAPEPVEEAVDELESEAPGREDPDDPDDQDMLFTFRNPGREDPDVEIALVGSPDLSYVSGVSTDERFDFSTLAILPDGRVAMSFADLSDENPMVAIEAPEADPAYFFEPTGDREEAADAYTGGQTARFELTVRPVQVPDDDTAAAVRDVLPAEWDVHGDSDDVERVESGETEDGEAVTYVYFAGDAPVNEDTTYTYYAETPSTPEESGVYTVGPAQTTSDNLDAVEDEDGWVDVAGTTDDDVVVGQGT